jgi:hypothetical protein
MLFPSSWSKMEAACTCKLSGTLPTTTQFNSLKRN